MRRHGPTAVRYLLLWAGAFLVTVALDYGAGVDFGLGWGFMFWFGIGLMLAYVTTTLEGR